MISEGISGFLEFGYRGRARERGRGSFPQKVLNPNRQVSKERKKKKNCEGPIHSGHFAYLELDPTRNSHTYFFFHFTLQFKEERKSPLPFFFSFFSILSSLLRTFPASPNSLDPNPPLIFIFIFSSILSLRSRRNIKNKMPKPLEEPMPIAHMMEKEEIEKVNIWTKARRRLSLCLL